MQVLIALGAGRSEGNVQNARVGDEIPRLGACQHLRVACEGKALGLGFGSDARVEFTKRSCQPREIVAIGRRGDVSVFGGEGGAVEESRDPSDQDENNVVLLQDSQQSLQIEFHVTHVRRRVPPRVVAPVAGVDLGVAGRSGVRSWQPE